MINSIDRDGIMQGFDLDLINSISKFSKVPLICSSGAGNLDHIYHLVKKTDCDAICLGSALHYKNLEIGEIKAFLSKKGCIIR